MPANPVPPKQYTDFIERFPGLSQAWELISQAGQAGPLDEKTQRVVKLAIAMGAMREGAVHAGVRKALAVGVSRETIDQVVALAAGTLGMPSTVAVYTWTQHESAD